MNDADEAPYPSKAEVLQAEYAHEWDIWREVRPNGRHGDWVAETLPDVPDHQLLRAKTIDGLAAQLREATS
ncbi:hypothetical protein GCM10022254_57300 [Actinomadura meridiana]|uniref:Uncharacterized protein n=2 Tax=Actinomadura meridiana TaxID=559626 RepID=A0ABP8CGI2_9ACTN